jgi:hypothetical protein
LWDNRVPGEPLRIRVRPTTSLRSTCFYGPVVKVQQCSFQCSAEMQRPLEPSNSEFSFAFFSQASGLLKKESKLPQNR